MNNFSREHFIYEHEFYFEKDTFSKKIKNEFREKVKSTRKNAFLKRRNYQIVYQISFNDENVFHWVIEIGEIVEKQLHYTIKNLDQLNRIDESNNSDVQLIINSFMKVLFKIDQEEELLWAVAKNVCEILGFEDCVLYLVIENEQKLRQYAHVTFENQKLKLNKTKYLFELDYGEGIVGKVPIKMDSILVNDVSGEGSYIVDDKQRSSELCVPIIYNNKLLGVIDSEHSKKEFYTRKHQQIFEGIALLTAIKLIQIRDRTSLINRNKRLNAIFENPTVGILFMNDRKAITFVNSAFEEMLGYTKGELNHVVIDTLITKKKEDELYDFFGSMIENKIDKIQFEEQYIKSNGNLIWCQNNVSLVQKSDDSYYMIAIIEDITGVKKAMLDNADLIKKLRIVNDELSDFAHIVSHDLKSPLRSINTLTEWLKEDFSNLGEEAINYLNSISSKTIKMNELINGILSYTEIGMFKNDKELIDLNKTIQNVIELVDIPDNFSIIVPEKLPVIKGNKTQLYQLFHNLITNSIKYNDKEKGEVVILYEIKNELINFQFSDNGKGIKKEYLDQIFGMFKTFDPVKNSTGIGLSIVKKIIEKYKGEIRAESEPGKGLTLFFTLKL